MLGKAVLNWPGLRRAGLCSAGLDQAKLGWTEVPQAGILRMGLAFQAMGNWATMPDSEILKEIPYNPPAPLPPKSKIS